MSKDTKRFLLCMGMVLSLTYGALISLALIDSSYNKKEDITPQHGVRYNVEIVSQHQPEFVVKAVKIVYTDDRIEVYDQDNAWVADYGQCYYYVRPWVLSDITKHFKK